MATILCVEDYENQQLLYELELSLEGYNVITASDGREAVKKVQQQPPDLIVMDISLPKMDGLEAMVRIQSINKDIPIIINTAYGNYKNRYMSWAADAYLVKSGDLTELKNTIKKLLNIRSYQTGTLV
jgi:CheY-like chemotaxis protein